MKQVAAVLLMLMLVGCAALMEGGSSAADDRRPRCFAEQEGKTWDLGTGRGDDIKRRAPGFFTPSNGNDRLRALPPTIAGVTDIKPTVADGSGAFEIITKDIPYKVRTFRADDMIGILVTPGKCPHVTAVDHCTDGRLSTNVAVSGTVTCLGAFSVSGDHVLVTMGGNSALKEKLAFGEPLFVGGNTASVVFSMFMPGETEPFAQVSRGVDDRSDVLPDEVIAVLAQGGMEKPAMLLFRGIQEPRKDSDALARIAEARVQGARKAAAKVQDPTEVMDLIRAHTMGAMPGDKEVFAIIGAKIREGVGALAQAEPKPETLFLVVTLTGFYKKTIGEPLDVSGMEPKYGPLLQQDGFKDDKVQGSFMLLFPASKYTKALEQQEAREAEQAKADAVARQHDGEIDGLWQEAKARGDEIAVLAYKIRFGNQNFVKSRHNVRGLQSVQLYRQGLVRDAFCPAKKAFIKATSAGEFQKRAAAHCKDESPVETGVGGTEVRLTADCQSAFGTGC